MLFGLFAARCLASWLAGVVACLFGGLLGWLACLLASWLACVFASFCCSLACLLAGWLAVLLACVLACLDFGHALLASQHVADLLKRSGSLTTSTARCPKSSLLEIASIDKA